MDRKITGFRGSPENENNRAGEVEVAGDVAAENYEEEITGEQPKQSYNYIGGNDEEGLDIYSPLVEKDNSHPDYGKLLKEAEAIVKESDTETLVRLMSQKEIHHTILRRLFETYRPDDKRCLEDDFRKLADALTEWEDLNGKVADYDLGEELTQEFPARYYSVLRKTELLFKDRAKRPYEDLTNEELVEAANNPKDSAQEKKHLSSESIARQKQSKNKTVKDIVEMVKNGELHISALEHLAQEYDFGREVPEEIKIKIERVFQDLGIKHKPLN